MSLSRTGRVVLVSLAALIAATAVIWLAREHAGGSSAGPPAPSSSATSADRVAFERVAGECAVVFTEGEARATSEAVALAALGCRSIGVDAASVEAPSVVIAPLAGPAELVEDAGLGGSVVARIAVGAEPGGCGAPRGVIAIVTVRGRRLDVDALGAWTGSCGSIEALSVASGDAGIVLLEPIEQPQATEDEPTAKLAVWRRVGADLVRVGTIAE